MATNKELSMFLLVARYSDLDVRGPAGKPFSMHARPVADKAHRVDACKLAGRR
jgi:hypothetical protein